MKSFSLDALEYMELLSLVERYASTSLGKTLVKALKPIEDKSELESSLRALEEALHLLEHRQVSWQFSDIFDPHETLAILRVSNASLDSSQLLELANLCSQAFSLRREIEDFKDEVPTLWNKLKTLPGSILGPVERVRKILKPGGEIEDNASPELLRIRREIQVMRQRLTRLLERVMHKASEAIQDEILTQRNERFVIPVKADFRGKIPGVAHGFSSSGATIFIEPLEAVQPNNEFQLLKEKEAEEIRRILFDLTNLFRAEIYAVEKAVEIIGEFDLIKAKVGFLKDFEAIIPKISANERLLLEQARHPLLEDSLKRAGKHVVPISFELTKDKPVMVVSGANAGGKTVVLKTTGILSLMALSGLPVTASRAEIPLYKSILADIGDKQSISASLSTFTSHISNIVEMLGQCRYPSLVLLDEVGTGTDPEEGAALGVAIVDYFYRRYNAQVIASTHYLELKTYASTNKHVLNACVEFDERTLAPTYRLLIGFAGSSSGIQIAKRFGLPDEIIEAAKQIMKNSAQQINDYLIKLRNEIRQVEDLQIALEEERRATAEKYEAIEKEARHREVKFRQKLEELLKEKISLFDREARSFIDTVEEKNLKAKLERELATKKAWMKRLASLEFEDSKGKAKSDSSIASEVKIEPGMKVLVKPLDLIGKVEKIEGDSAWVLIGSMRKKESLENLQAVLEAQKEKVSSRTVPLEFQPNYGLAELNLIGKTTLEAEDEIDRFLDRSYMQGLRKVRIIHGIGTGSLRRAVHQFLKNHPHVEKFSLADKGQGGEGATIVELKL